MADAAQQQSAFKQNENRPAAFVQKLYQMIDACDPALATWTKEGNMFVIKDPETFSQTIIPKYFIHNKFSSFARQLNFYGFRKVPTKPIRNDDFDITTAQHVLFHHPLFQKGRPDLLPEIKRHSAQPKAATAAATAAKKQHSTDELMSNDADKLEQKEIEELKERVASLKAQLRGMEHDYHARVEELNRDYLHEVKTMLNALPKGLLDVSTVFKRTSSVIVPSTTTAVTGSDVVNPSSSVYNNTGFKTFGSSQARIVSSDIAPSDNVVGMEV